MPEAGNQKGLTIVTTSGGAATKIAAWVAFSALCYWATDSVGHMKSSDLVNPCTRNPALLHNRLCGAWEDQRADVRNTSQPESHDDSEPATFVHLEKK